MTRSTSTATQSRMLSRSEFYSMRAAHPDDAVALCSLARLIGSFGHLTDNIDKNSASIEMSRLVLDGRAQLDQSDLVFLTEHHQNQVVQACGTCKLGRMIAACWHRDLGRARTYTHTNRDLNSSPSELEYETFPKKAIEFGGNRVSPTYRNRRLGYYQTLSRLMFLKANHAWVNQVAGEIEWLCSSLRTVTIYEILKRLSKPDRTIDMTFGSEEFPPNGSMLRAFVEFAQNMSTADAWAEYLESRRALLDVYPFYEQVVRTLLGGIDYAEADQLRYANVNEDGQSPFLQRMLGGDAKQRRIFIYNHMMSFENRMFLGEVHPETVGAEMALKKARFIYNGRHDIMDAGAIYERRVAGQIDRCVVTQRASIKRLPRIVQESPLTVVLFPVGCSAGDFWTVLCAADSNGDDTLRVDENVHDFVSARGTELVEYAIVG